MAETGSILVGLKGIDGVNLTSEELKIEAKKQMTALEELQKIVADNAQGYLDTQLVSARADSLQRGFEANRLKAIAARATNNPVIPVKPKEKTPWQKLKDWF